jgi:hypothetical protein
LRPAVKQPRPRRSGMLQSGAGRLDSRRRGTTSRRSSRRGHDRHRGPQDLGLAPAPRARMPTMRRTDGREAVHDRLRKVRGPGGLLGPVPGPPPELRRRWRLLVPATVAGDLGARPPGQSLVGRRAGARLGDLVRSGLAIRAVRPPPACPTACKDARGVRFSAAQCGIIPTLESHLGYFQGPSDSW